MEPNQKWESIFTTFIMVLTLIFFGVCLYFAMIYLGTPHVEKEQQNTNITVIVNIYCHDTTYEGSGTENPPASQQQTVFAIDPEKFYPEGDVSVSGTSSGTNTPVIPCPTGSWEDYAIPKEIGCP